MVRYNFISFKNSFNKNMQTSIKKDKRKTKVCLTQLQSSFEKDVSTEGEDSPRTQTKAKDYHLHNK